MFTPTDILLVLAIVALASFVQGYGGFGFGIISVTIFSFLAFDLERMLVVVTMTALVLLAALFWQSRKEGRVVWRKIALFLVGAAVGMPVGYWFIRNFGDHGAFRILFALVVAAFAVHGLKSPKVYDKLPRWLAVPVGVASGFLSGAFGASGPPLIIYLYSQVEDPREMKASVQLALLVLVLFRLTTVGLGGLGLTKGVMPLPLYAVPVAVPLQALGHRLSQRSSVELFKKCVYSLMGVFALIILAKGVMQCLG